MFDWNDLKYLLAVAREGSTLGAARSLHVNQSTVQRRIAELESRLGLRLVERLPSGYRLTLAGEAVIPAAQDVAAAVEAFQYVVTVAAHPTILRLTCPEPIGLRLAESGLIDRFRERNPGFSVEFVLADRYIDLSKGEADVALRSGDTDADLIGQKVAESIWAVYASRAYIDAYGAPLALDDLRDHRLIGFESGLAKHRLSVWLRERFPEAIYAARSNSVLGLVSAARAGVGVAALPVALGDAEAGLVRVLDVVPELTRPWRILAHRNARQLPKVDAFFRFITADLAALKPILSG